MKKYSMRFEGLEPVIIIEKTEPRLHEVKEIGLFYPYWRLKRKYGVEPERCGGCGDGWAIWVIDNPNYGEHDTWFVGDCCVNFYDVRMSKRPLPYNKQEVKDGKRT